MIEDLKRTLVSKREAVLAYIERMSTDGAFVIAESTGSVLYGHGGIGNAGRLTGIVPGAGYLTFASKEAAERTLSRLKARNPVLAATYVDTEGRAFEAEAETLARLIRGLEQR